MSLSGYAVLHFVSVIVLHFLVVVKYSEIRFLRIYSCHFTKIKALLKKNKTNKNKKTKLPGIPCGLPMVFSQRGNPRTTYSFPVSEVAETPCGKTWETLSNHSEVVAFKLPKHTVHYLTWEGRDVWNNCSWIPLWMCSSVCNKHSHGSGQPELLIWRYSEDTLCCTMTALCRELVLLTQVWQAFCSSLNKR